MTGTVIYGVCPPNAFPDDFQRSVCYSEIYGTYAQWYQSKIKDKRFYSLFRLESKKDVEKANWYLREWALPRIPDRLKGAYEIRRAWKKYYPAWDAHDETRRFAWVDIRIDPSKMSMTDMICLLFLIRMPQEHMQCVNNMHDLFFDGKESLDVCFWKGQLLTRNSNHSFITLGLLTPPPGWDFKTIWEKFPAEPPATQAPGKTIHINRTFTGGGYFAHP